MLSGAADTAHQAVGTLGPATRGHFVAEARHAGVDAFAATNRVLAAVAFATAIAALALLRSRATERHGMAHMAAHLHTARDLHQRP